MTTFHLVAVTVVVTAFLTSSIAELLIGHYVSWVDKRMVPAMTLIKGLLILLAAVALIYDASDFDRGSIDWYMPLLFAAAYFCLCLMTIREVLKPAPWSLLQAK